MVRRIHRNRKARLYLRMADKPALVRGFGKGRDFEQPTDKAEHNDPFVRRFVRGVSPCEDKSYQRNHRKHVRNIFRSNRPPQRVL